MPQGGIMFNSINVTEFNAGSVFVVCSPINPSFHADSGHWYLSQGIVGINNVSLIQKTSLSEQHLVEQKEF